MYALPAPTRPFMARRFFRKWMPRPEAVNSGGMGRVFGRLLLDRRIWLLNRHSVARGLGWGVFWGFIPTAGQTIGAAACAIGTGGNVPLSFAGTWVSNPLTWVPCLWFVYRVGVLITGVGLTADPWTEIEHLTGMGLWQFVTGIAAYAAANGKIVVPLLVGGAATGTVAGGLTYFGVKGFWRWNIVRRWHRRGHHLRCGQCKHLVIGEATDDPKQVEKVCPNCGAKVPIYRRVGLGFAALARRLRERGQPTPDARPTPPA